MSKYRLELCVTDQGSEFYPAIGTLEKPSAENAGYDLKIVVNQVSTPVATLVPLGVKARLLKYDSLANRFVGCHFSLEPRSSIYKTGFMMANGRGIIDRSYRGELMAPMVTVGSNYNTLQAGTRLFQVIAPDMAHISEVAYVDSLPDTERGSGGFGSTGLK